jgi:predicted PurR-regulated permease PerM
VSWIVAAALLVSLAVVVVQVLSHFAAALTWAVIITVTLWPAHRWIRLRLGLRPGAAASLTTLLVTLGLVLPVSVITLLLVREIETLTLDVESSLTTQLEALQQVAARLPVIGEAASGALEVIREDRSRAVKALAGENNERMLALARDTVDAISRNVFKLGVCLFTMFFLFLHGDSLAAQLRLAGVRVGGPRLEVIFHHVGFTVRSVVYGLVMTAMIQGWLAALGFWAAGVPFPWLLGALTVVLSFVPMGHAVVWVPAATYLLLQGHYVTALLLAAWGAAVVGSVDNVIRPAFIGIRTGIPVLLVFVGVLGGILSFGLVGLFVGPVAIAVTLALWWEWIGTPLEFATTKAEPRRV